MDKKFRYEIGGKTYIQRPLVWGQMRQLMDLTDGVVIIPTGPKGLIDVLGNKMSQALAIVLIEEGATLDLKDRNIEAIAEELDWMITAETTLQVVADFFDCNPVVSILERLRGKIEEMSVSIIKIIISMISRIKEPTGLKRSASSSPAGISPKGTPSSGDIPPESASPGSGTAPEM